MTSGSVGIIRLVVTTLLSAVANLVVPTIGVWGFVRFVQWVRQNGGWAFLGRLLLQGYQAAPGAQPGGPRGARPQAPGQRQQQQRATAEEVSAALARLPIEAYRTEQQLAALPVHELKALLRGRRLAPPVAALEKDELVRQLMDHGGSSASSCSICLQDYRAAGCGGAGGGGGVDATGIGAQCGKGARGAEQAAAEGTAGAGESGEGCGGRGGDGEPDALRVLRCGHRFHVECVDRWFLAAADYTRPPACPLCNAPLLERHAGPGGRGGAGGAGRREGARAQAARS